MPSTLPAMQVPAATRCMCLPPLLLRRGHTGRPHMPAGQQAMARATDMSVRYQQLIHATRAG